mgnify:CR=1 FL=1
MIGGCRAPWKPLHQGDGWSLYVQDASKIEPAPYLDAFGVARPAVESIFGPFERHVRVFAWSGGVRMRDGSRGDLVHDLDTIEDVPGIGLAKVQAFHARGGDFLGERSGVFMGAVEVGTAVHELVHARLAEFSRNLPLWLEEGIATVCGDGIVRDGVWVRDGLACWHLRELSEEQLDDATLTRLLNVQPGQEHDFRDNVLVHFLGWAIVFDLMRESNGELEWQRWIDKYKRGIDLAEARRRIERSLDPRATRDWLARLEDPDPGVRLAATKGTWKLRSRAVAELLLHALDEEKDPEVRASLAVNALATAGETRLGRRLYWWMWRSITPVLEDSRLESNDEREAIDTLYRFYRYEVGKEQSKVALEKLARFLDE